MTSLLSNSNGSTAAYRPSLAGVASRDWGFGRLTLEASDEQKNHVFAPIKESGL